MQSVFQTQFNGSFKGVLKWEQLETLWNSLLNDDTRHWYIYTISETPPATCSSHAALETFITEIDLLLKRDHDKDYCGIVYADDLATPTMIKIYDPHNLGVSCGFSDNPPLPGWILSQATPEDLASMRAPASRQRWWQQLFRLARTG